MHRVVYSADQQAQNTPYPGYDPQQNNPNDPAQGYLPQKSDPEQKEKLDDIVNKSSRILLNISSILPFDLWISEVIADENRVSLIFISLFGAKNIYSVPIADIVSVQIECGPLFATLEIKSKVFGANPPPAKYLSRNDAIRARRIIEGLALCTEQGIDFSKLQPKELVQKAEELGSSSELA